MRLKRHGWCRDVSEEALRMQTRHIARLALTTTLGVLVLLLLLGACGPVPAPSQPTTAPPRAASATPIPEETSKAEPAGPLPDEVEPMTPQQVVERFYSWYVGYIRNAGDPITDRAYRSSEYITQEFVRRVDEAVSVPGHSEYDPFLHAQEAPEEITVAEPLVSGEAATVAVHEIWDPGTRYELIQNLEATLQLMDDEWRIADITVRMSPEEVVEAFYWWYTGYPGNPASDGVYRSSQYVSAEFAQRADGLIASGEDGGYDPFLCAQDTPGQISIEETIASSDEASVLVRTSFEEHTFAVQLRQSEGRWAIDDVVCTWIWGGEETPTADWQVFADERYGFQIRYPEGWTYAEESPIPPGTELSDELKALKRVLLFAPAGWEDATPPLYVEVVEGTQEAFDKIFPPSASSESLDISGFEAVKTSDDLGEFKLIRYAFQSPSDEDVHIVILDAIGGFPERAEGKDVVKTVQQMIFTFEFTQ
jgi:hypothetical protein